MPSDNFSGKIQTEAKALLIRHSFSSVKAPENFVFFLRFNADSKVPQADAGKHIILVKGYFDLRARF